MNMKKKLQLVTIAKDDFPLELIEGRPLMNFLRKLLHTSHVECKECYERRKGIKLA
jgi:hypothetical protein